jgi:hypothetical protein
MGMNKGRPLDVECREPAYGAAAERYQRCAKLGESTLSVLLERRAKINARPQEYELHACLAFDDLVARAAALGLLPGEAKEADRAD